MYAIHVVNPAPRIIVTVKKFICIQCRRAELGIINFSGQKSVAAMAAPSATVPMPTDAPFFMGI